MDREIKFKVFHKGSITERIKIDGYERINGNRWEWMSLEMNPDKGERWSRGVYSWSDKYIRAQFAGLKDKDGQEIYEGDIIDAGADWIDVVKWNDQCAGFGLWNESKKKWDDTQLTGMRHLIVVGNIFEHSHLLEPNVSIGK